jgi:hypothetical protein
VAAGRFPLHDRLGHLTGEDGPSSPAGLLDDTGAGLNLGLGPSGRRLPSSGRSPPMVIQVRLLSNSDFSVAQWVLVCGWSRPRAKGEREGRVRNTVRRFQFRR